MYVVICDNPDGGPDVFAPFDSLESAQEWANTISDLDCPNEHYPLEACMPVVKGSD